MTNVAILDTLLGDNGKGHFTHFFSRNFDWVIRHAGSSNCGHVIYRDGKKFTHHLLPSADYRKSNIKSFLASGMYINPQELYEEIKLAEQDFPGVGKTIYVDPEAFVITPAHVRFDRENNQKVGSTGKGVSPAAVSKYSRTGCRLYDLINDNAPIINDLKKQGVQFTPLLALREIFERSNLLFEGNQGVLLDIQAGLYPNITTSDCTVAGIYASGFHFVKLDRVYGLLKPYLTRAGTPGPLPTEMPEQEAQKWRERGGEIGATTSKPRRIGYLDLPMVKYGVQRGGITHLIISKMDIPEGEEKLQICVDYGKSVFTPDDFKDVKPHYVTILGWKNSKDLNQIKNFLQLVEQHAGISIEYISTGIKNQDIIHLNRNKNLDTAMLDNKDSIEHESAARFSDPFDNPHNANKYCLCACDKCGLHGPHNCGRNVCSYTKSTVAQTIPTTSININNVPNIKWEVYYDTENQILGYIEAPNHLAAIRNAFKYFSFKDTFDSKLKVRKKS